MSKLTQYLKGKIPDDVLRELSAIEEQFGVDNLLIAKLTEDVNTVLAGLSEDPDNDYLKRTLVRTLFAMIEGVIWTVKRSVLVLHEAGECELSKAEYAMLAEESYDLADTGTPRVSQKFLKLKTNLRFAFRIAALKLANKEFEIDAGASPWQDFLTAIEVRNRLMHPKSPEDLRLTDAEMHSATETARWFAVQAKQLWAVIGEARMESAKARVAEGARSLRWAKAG